MCRLLRGPQGHPGGRPSPLSDTTRTRSPGSAPARAARMVGRPAARPSSRRKPPPPRIRRSEASEHARGFQTVCHPGGMPAPPRQPTKPRVRHGPRRARRRRRARPARRGADPAHCTGPTPDEEMTHDHASHTHATEARMQNGCPRRTPARFSVEPRPGRGPSRRAGWRSRGRVGYQRRRARAVGPSTGGDSGAVPARPVEGSRGHSGIHELKGDTSTVCRQPRRGPGAGRRRSSRVPGARVRRACGSG
jgi:hypothetical protein